MRVGMAGVAQGSVVGTMLLLAGCDQASVDRRTETTWVDSAGVTIVHSPELGADPEAWWIDPEPSVIIGAADGEGEYLLSGVADAGILPDGRIFVADMATLSVRLFDQQGRFLQAWGRGGQGPGEFMLPLAAVHPYRGDSVAVVEMGGRQISIFDANGDFGRRIVPTYDFRPTPGRLPAQSCCALIGPFPDGGWLAEYPEESSTEGSGPRRGQVRVVRLTADGEVSGEFGTFDGSVWRETTPGMPNPFARTLLGPRLSITIAAERVIVGDGTESRVDEFDANGRLLRSFRIAREPLLLGPEAKAAYEEGTRRAFADGAGGGSPLAEAIVRFRLAHLPEQLPAYGSILTDPQGHTWLIPFDVPYHKSAGTREGLVLNAEGAAIGTVILPSDARILAVGTDVLLGVETHEMGVERLVLHRIVRPRT